MTKKDFKEKYFTDNFYWVSPMNYRELQNIGIEFGCVNVMGREEIIEWHDGFKCLGFRTYEHSNGITKYQKEPFLLVTEQATNYSDMLDDYTKLNNNS